MKGNNYNHKLPTIEILKEHYFGEKMSASDIAKRYSVTMGAVLIKFRRYNIKRRSLSEAQEIIANHISLTKIQIDFIEGLLLGDGCVIITPEKKSAVYSHADKNLEYIEWLIKNFKQMKIDCAEIKQHPDTLCYSVKTKYYREFVFFRNKWYPNGKKKIPLNYQITPIGLFNWYIGDGSYHKNTNRNSGREKLVLCSQFDQEGKKRISDQFKNINIENSVYFDCIYIKAKSRKVFFEYMFNHKYSIPGCYKYKFKMENE